MGVWWARVADAAPGLDRLLAPADLERRARLARQVDRDRTTVAWAVARTVVGERLGVPPASLRVDRRCDRCGEQHGRPRLPDHPDVHLSVTHGGDLVAVAVAAHPVGVDVEPVVTGTADELAALAGEVLCGPELAAWGCGSPDELPRTLTTAWVAKEAALKAAGVGLLVPLHDVDAIAWPLPGDAPWVRPLDVPAPDYVAAVAGYGPVPSLTTHDAVPLLAPGYSSRRVPGATTRSQR